ncbi:RNA-directed DNA polymerase, eukaryota [Tanacetum coccineum]|uniref:RNA-directed DNA polymerase, eukaryota n=1 Tax=Tanacetum coccineum TaxID=301880 RepID=A0ABQ5AK43_9ASTR
MAEKNLTWIKWKKSMARKKDGGLGISLYSFNRALLYKWKWRFHTMSDVLWVKIIKISKELDSKNVSLDALVKKRIGDGWLRRRPRGGAELGCRIEQGGDLEVPRWTWKKIGNGILEVENRLGGGQKNKTSWRGTNFCPCIIDTGFLVIDNTPTRWSKDVPIKINVFIWKLLPICDNLEKKGLGIPSTLCGICDDVVETGSHVFMRCQFALEIWRQIARWWDLDIPHMLSMKELLGWVDNLKISKKSKEGFVHRCDYRGLDHLEVSE